MCNEKTLIDLQHQRWEVPPRSHGHVRHQTANETWRQKQMKAADLLQTH